MITMKMVKLPEHIEQEFPTNIRKFREMYFKFMDEQKNETNKKIEVGRGTVDKPLSN